MNCVTFVVLILIHLDLNHKFKSGMLLSEFRGSRGQVYRFINLVGIVVGLRVIFINEDGKRNGMGLGEGAFIGSVGN